MKKLLFVTLLMLPCVSICQITVLDSLKPSVSDVYLDSLKLSPEQVVNIYVGLQEKEILESRLEYCQHVSDRLNIMIQQQNDSLQSSIVMIKNLDNEINKNKSILLHSAVDMEKLKNKKTPWYKHPVIWSFVGFFVGCYLFKN